MKIKVNNKTFDGKKDIVMIRTDSDWVYCNGQLYTDGGADEVVVILTGKDRKNIMNMAPGCTLYCEFPTKLWKQYPDIVDDMMSYFKNYYR